MRHDRLPVDQGQRLLQSIREAGRVSYIRGRYAVQRGVEAIEVVEPRRRLRQQVVLVNDNAIPDDGDTDGAEAAPVAIRRLDVERRKVHARECADRGRGLQALCESRWKRRSCTRR